MEQEGVTTMDKQALKMLVEQRVVEVVVTRLLATEKGDSIQKLEWLTWVLNIVQAV